MTMLKQKYSKPLNHKMLKSWVKVNSNHEFSFSISSLFQTWDSDMTLGFKSVVSKQKNLGLYQKYGISWFDWIGPLTWSLSGQTHSPWSLLVVKNACLPAKEKIRMWLGKQKSLKKFEIKMKVSLVFDYFHEAYSWS